MKNKLQTIGLCAMLSMTPLVQAKESENQYEFNIDDNMSVVYTKNENDFCIDSFDSGDGVIVLDKNCDGNYDNISFNGVNYNIPKNTPNMRVSEELYKQSEQHYINEVLSPELEDTIDLIEKVFPFKNISSEETRSNLENYLKNLEK
jgi:hypothetical protein